ncbi:MAG: MerR family transcriptional regulator [Candidatus Omnitrophica bacterium]|nr:MerR family transcriptional regulator [Candidatus Omnitrophota bacterium]
MVRNIYLLKDLARITGYSTHTIKYYLKIGLIKEFGRSPETNFRYFTDNTVKLLGYIRQLRKEKKSIACIKEIIKHKKYTK